MDIHNSFMDIQNFELWISKNRFSDIHNHIMDIQNSNCGYP